MAFRFFVWLLFGVAFYMGLAHWDRETTEARRDIYLAQLRDSDDALLEIRRDYAFRHAVYFGAFAAWLVLGSVLFASETRSAFKAILKEF